MSLSRLEKEHIVRICDDPEEPLSFYTHNRLWAKKLEKAGATISRVSKQDGKEVAWTLSMPSEWFRVPKAKNREKLTEGQREALRERGSRLKKHSKLLISEQTKST